MTTPVLSKPVEKITMKRIICLILGHKYYRVRKLAYMSELVGCNRCGKFYGMNHDVRAILPFDQEMCDMYASMVTYKLKRLQKYVCKDKLFSLFRG